MNFKPILKIHNKKAYIVYDEKLFDCTKIICTEDELRKSFTAVMYFDIPILIDNKIYKTCFSIPKEYQEQEHAVFKLYRNLSESDKKELLAYGRNRKK